MQEGKRKPGRPKGSKNKPKNDTAQKEKPVKTSSRIKDEIWSVIIIAMGVFLIISFNTNAAGEVGHFLKEILKGSFGLVAMALPYYLIIYGLLLLLRKAVHITAKSMVFLALIFLMICIMNSSLYIDSENLTVWPMDFKGFYQDGISLEGGGLFGTVLGLLLIKTIGTWGLYISSIVVILICLLLILNTPFSQFFSMMKARRAEKKQRKEEVSIFKEEPLIEEAVIKTFDESEEEGPLVKPVIHPVKEKPFIKDESLSENQLKILGMVNDDSLFKGRGREKQRGFGLEGDPDKTGETVFGLGDGNSVRTGKVLSQAVNYSFPPVSLLEEVKQKGQKADTEALKLKAKKLEETLKNFNVGAKVIQVIQGPTVTRYELSPDVGVKVNSITKLADDIALNLEARSIRIEAPIPGRAAVGIEVENERVNLVTIREMVSSKEFKQAKSKIAFAIGKDLSGNPVIADIKEMPHMLIAGSTGSGKSVCINSIITSLLYRALPSEVKLLLIDPKVVELARYNGIPHLLAPVVTDPQKATAVLNWAVSEMTKRYKQFAEISVRDLEHYNEKMIERGLKEDVLPQIVIIIDELADLMMAAPSQVEEAICRLAQMARAAGMHLVVATQRPSVDVLTGVIKANIPSRIAFAVASQFDSRTILDMSGAEKLVGKGDMLFSLQGLSKPIRVQGTFISDSEVGKVIEYINSQGQEAYYKEEILEAVLKPAETESQDQEDEFYREAVDMVAKQGQASVSMLQRRFRIGYNRAARIIDMMEQNGIIGPQDGSRPRQVLITEADLYGLPEGAEEEK